MASECLDERSRAAYEAAGEMERARLHDLRAAELEATGEFALRLGAVPFHRERGTDPRGRGRRRCGPPSTTVSARVSWTRWPSWARAACAWPSRARICGGVSPSARPRCWAP
nr:hypothetical protein GCM10020093_048510 [Planobispora longispora]